MPTTSRIAILRYHGALASAAFGMEEMLRFASSVEARRTLSVEILDDVRSGYDAYVLPPAAQHIDVSAHPEWPRMLQNAHAEGALMCSVCAGVTWLAEAGVIGARPVTTHWDLETHMRARHPTLLMDVDQILIEHSDLVTAGGMMAWTDLCMALIERYLGRDAMLETSRRFVVDVGGRDQRRYRRFTPNLTHADSAIRKAQLAIEQRFAELLTIGALAQVAGMSERTFVRRFAAVTGLPPMTYVQAIRIEKAKDLLVQSDKPVQQVAFDVGYADHSAFGRKFAGATGMAPRAFRRTFAP